MRVRAGIRRLAEHGGFAIAAWAFSYHLSNTLRLRSPIPAVLPLPTFYSYHAFAPILTPHCHTFDLPRRPRFDHRTRPYTATPSPLRCPFHYIYALLFLPFGCYLVCLPLPRTPPRRTRTLHLFPHAHRYTSTTTMALDILAAPHCRRHTVHT